MAVRKRTQTTTSTMHVTIDSNVHAQVKESAKRADRTVAAQIRQLIKLGLEAEKKAQGGAA